MLEIDSLPGTVTIATDLNLVAELGLQGHAAIDRTGIVIRTGHQLGGNSCGLNVVRYACGVVGWVSERSPLTLRGLIRRLESNQQHLSDRDYWRSQFAAPDAVSGLREMREEMRALRVEVRQLTEVPWQFNPLLPSQVV